MQNIRRFLLGLSFVFSLVLLTQCGRANDFLYHVVDPPREVVTTHTKIKEMLGINRLDVLWVIDNSGSMSSHQRSVVNNTKDFMNAFTSRKRLDWKMGIVSTAQQEEPYLGFTATDALDGKTPDPVTKFQDAVRRLGLNRGCPELVFEPVMKSLTKYPSFVRSHSVFAILALTDTMEEQPPLKASFENYLRTLKGDMKMVRFYGTFAGRSFGCQSGEPVWDYPGSPFEYFINLTKGKVFNLCAADFGKNLALVGEDMAKAVTYSRVFLSARPKIPTLSIAYKGTPLRGGPQASGGRWFYDFDLNAVVFYDLDFAADDNDFVDIKYDLQK